MTGTLLPAIGSGSVVGFSLGFLGGGDSILATYTIYRSLRAVWTV
ncbi:hypothetical protein [Rhizobium sp. SL42]|nr:hypothetical protein [Rhizobium sp. SL42]